MQFTQGVLAGMADVSTCVHCSSKEIFCGAQWWLLRRATPVINMTRAALPKAMYGYTASWWPPL